MGQYWIILFFLKLMLRCFFRHSSVRFWIRFLYIENKSSLNICLFCWILERHDLKWSSLNEAASYLLLYFTNALLFVFIVLGKYRKGISLQTLPYINTFATHQKISFEKGFACSAGFSCFSLSSSSSSGRISLSLLSINL